MINKHIYNFTSTFLKSNYFQLFLSINMPKYSVVNKLIMKIMGLKMTLFTLLAFIGYVIIGELPRENIL